MAGPPVGRLPPAVGRDPRQPKLVEAQIGATADAGSIPAASILRLNRADSRVSFGRNDFFLPLLFEPTRVGVHGRLEVGLVAVPVDPEGRIQVGVTERL
jgi:hypothetical protein